MTWGPTATDAAVKEFATEALTRAFTYLHAALQLSATTQAQRRQADRLMDQIDAIGAQLMSEAHQRHNVYPLRGPVSREARRLGLHPGRYMDEERQRLYDMADALSTAAHTVASESFERRRARAD